MLWKRKLGSERVLVLDGHPDGSSYCAALAKASAEGARAKGVETRLIRLSELAFDPNLEHGYNKRMTLEPSLELVREALTWCDTLVLVHPLWWGSCPAKLKGLFDRALLPEFAFRYVEGKAMPEKLLAGRNARVIITSDTPGWFLRYVYGNGWVKILRRQILGFVGFGDLTIRIVGPVRGAKPGVVENGLGMAARILD
ncbi:MAG: NAD(P)H-dependent oxidoreductase [Hoeflea sp.]|uniref:NAD(P)H-dependent oxidoreductase n=1 Tax=Hoeflea sp. TaxID=1940281 RepID=UPI003EF09240